MKTGFFPHFYTLFLMAALLAAPVPVCSSSLPRDPTQSNTADPTSPQAPQEVSRLLLTYPVTREAETWKTSFDMHPGRHGHGTPDFLLQRAEYRGNDYSLMSEMGDLLLDESPNTVQEIKQRGGMLTFGSGNQDNAFKLKSFATTGQGEGILAGTSAELSLLKERARFKTIYINGRESIPSDGQENFREKNGSVLGLITVLEPVKDLLAIEAEADYSLFDLDTTDDADSLRDSAYRLKARGTAGPYRYSAAFERTGPKYHVISGNGPRRNLEGVVLNMGTGFQLHTLDFSLSRHNDNLANDRFLPRFYRSEGNIDYTFKGITCLPMGVRYRKTLVESAREPAGYGQSASDADTFSGRMNYVAGEWDLGMKASYSQRRDKIRDQRETEATSIVFSPKISSGQVTVAPDISLRRSRFFRERQQSDEYAINLGIQGKGKLDYEVRGGYRKERSSPSSGSDFIGASVRMGYPLDRIIRKIRKPSLQLKCEYKDTANRTTETRNNFYSFLLTVDGASFF